jgi:phenylacetate-coenzyme A ligase PaaK-like adenylate-forming protein
MIDELLSMEPYSLAKPDKQRLLTKSLVELTQFHYQNCPQYRGMLDAYGYDPSCINSYMDLLPLPVRLFKELRLTSINDDEVFKVMTSSGTTGQAVSRIFLDRDTASLQQKVLVKIVSSFLGSSRLPMIIIDSPSVIKDRTMFSARGAGILGFSIFARDKTFALDDDMKLDINGLRGFLEKHRGQRILLFGFTFMVWQHFYRELQKISGQIDLSHGILFHGGGWKKLTSQSVSSEVFKAELKSVCGINDVHDYYGMVEQTGCIYVECEQGHLHASIFSDIITRRAADLSICDVGELGIIEVVSTLAKSYPGHALLTEDEGTVLGEDDCPCGRLGKYFTINGRLKDAEIRGCSDTYAASI